VLPPVLVSKRRIAKYQIEAVARLDESPVSIT